MGQQAVQHHRFRIFANNSSTLYSVLWQVIDQLYDNNLDSDRTLPTNELLNRVFTIEGHLAQWRRGLSNKFQLVDHLALSKFISGSSPSNSSWNRTRLRTILTLRHTNVRLLLHRPVILSLLNHRDGSEAQASQDDVFYQLCNTSIKVSMEAASNLIAVVYVAVTGQ